ncbi:MAG: tetratricopeptide repeat protein [Chloracidobacterium sp.]|nr:tetratricopeptide repeat protein [Chloracidobacterium sp.]
MSIAGMIRAIGLTIGIVGSVYAQTGQMPSTPAQLPAVSIERRREAMERMLEGQRLLLASNRLRSEAAINATVERAREAFLKVVELDPSIAEAYTSLAEIAVSTPPNDIGEAIKYALAAVRVDSTNFGGRRLLARLYTIRARGADGKFEPGNSALAVANWREVTILDPRNAEAWAFLASLYEVSGRKNEEIDALRKWVSSAPPIDTQFYQAALGRTDTLTVETASLRLGQALVATNNADEALTVLGNLAADDPGNVAATEVLGDAIALASDTAVRKATELLRQAAYGDPSNLKLIGLLLSVFERGGASREAVALLQRSIESTAKSDPLINARLLIELGDLFRREQKFDIAADSYEKALIRIGDPTDADSKSEINEIVRSAFGKLSRIDGLRLRPTGIVKLSIRSRTFLGKDSQFPDRLVIDHYRSIGKRIEALAAVKSLRVRFGTDEGLRRLEATVLAESGMISDAVKLMKARWADAANRPAAATEVPLTPFDEFSDLLFISDLAARHSSPVIAVDAARRALTKAVDSDRRQIAQLSVATALQRSGEFKAAEEILRELLRQTPGNPMALNNLGYFLVERNERLDEAVVLIRGALSIDPTNGSYLDSLGWALFHSGKIDAAESELRKAIRYDDTSVTAFEHLGDVLAKKGDLAEARKCRVAARANATSAEDVRRLDEKLK